MTSQDLGNNETISNGIAKNSDGTFTALTFSQSKSFKTEKGAIKWLEKRGYDKNGNETKLDLCLYGTIALIIYIVIRG